LARHEKFCEQISIKFGGFSGLVNQDEFGTNCTEYKHTNISVKILAKICIRSVDTQKVKYRR